MPKQRSRIVLVDDNKASLDQGRNLLKAFYEVFPVTSAAKLFEILENIAPDLILLDVEMPEMSGYEAIKVLKGDARRAGIPVIFLTSKDDEESELVGFDLGAADYVHKPFYGQLLLKRVEKELQIVQQKIDLLEAQERLRLYADDVAKMVEEKAGETIEVRSAVLSTLLDMAEFRGQGHGGDGHAARVRLYAKALLDEMGRSGVYADEISAWDEGAFLTAAQLHDVGKMAVPDRILGKPGKLDDGEFEAVKGHVAAGIYAIETMMGRARDALGGAVSEARGGVMLGHALRVVGAHHEKWDGSGYPKGLKGKSIPLEGRIAAIVDVYDALVSERPHRAAFTRHDAGRVIENGSWTHFEPLLVDVFLKVEADFAGIAQRG
jgi:putative two-component system response regulator